MKILYIITQADGGGAQNYTLALAKHFNGVIAAGTEATKLFADAETAGLKTHQLKYLKRNIHPFYDVLALFELVRLIKKVKPEIVHLNSSKAGFLGGLAKPFVDAKIIFTAHGFIFNEPFSPLAKWFYLILEKFASLFRDYIITVSDADRQSALKHNLINKNKISTVHNGIGPINFLQRDEAKKALNLPNHKLIFGTIANFYRTKGLDVLITAVSILADDIKSVCQFVIIGDGAEFENCKLKIKNLQLENNIKLLGKINNANLYLHAFDSVILPSRKEGFPYVLLEAMQAGLPIIVTAVGGNAEAVGDAGILITPENPSALAQAIKKIAKQDLLRFELGQKALDRAKLFTLEKMLLETKKVYEKIAQE